MDYYLLTDLAARVGYHLALSGAETFRVEETIRRIIGAYGIECEAFSIPNCVMVSLEAANGKPLMVMKRVGFHGNDLEALEKLNALKFKSLHYTNALGTDLTVELPEGHIWEAGNDVTLSGQEYIANIPTEELFTSPLKTGVNGVVYASLPLVHDGNIIDGFHFVVKDGKIVEARARQGEETLQAAIAVDEGASYFGEVALVPYDSPISNQKILFYNTLFDENAACHIAFGEAYPCLEGGQKMTKEELKARGLNDSITHVDFMVGTPDLRIVGTTHDGREIPVFENGNFAQGF